MILVYVREIKRVNICWLIEISKDNVDKIFKDKNREKNLPPNPAKAYNT